MPLVRVGENHNFGSGMIQYPFCSPFFGAFLQSCRTTYCTEEQKDSSAWRLALRYLSVRTRLDPVLYPLNWKQCQSLNLSRIEYASDGICNDRPGDGRCLARVRETWKSILPNPPANTLTEGMESSYRGRVLHMRRVWYWGMVEHTYLVSASSSRGCRPVNNIHDA